MKYPLDTPEISNICRDCGVKELSVFGSAARDELRPDSDIDFLVLFDNDDYGPWMSKLTTLRDALCQVLHRPVDVVPKDQVKWVIRDAVLSSAKVIYAK